MNDKYLDQKIKEILMFIETNQTPPITHTKKFLKLILEAVWLDGKAEGVQLAREILKE